MATIDETVSGAFTAPGGIIEGYKSLINPKNVPTGSQLAPNLQQQQLDAMAMTQAGIGSYQPFLTAGARATQQALASTGPGAAQQYLNPYLKQQAATTMTDLNRMFGAQQAQQQQSAIQSGSFAGSGTRNAVMQAELQRGQADTAAKTLGNIYSGGYNMAQRAAQQAAQQQGQLGAQFGTLGRMAQDSLYKDVNQLYGQGENQRQILGAQNLAQYQTPFYGLGQFAGALQGAPSFSTYQNTNPILSGIAGFGASMFGK